MKTDIFVLADSVNIYERGKFVIVGTFDRIQSRDIPFVFRPFGIAIKIIGGKNDFGKKYDARLIIRKKHAKKPVHEAKLEIGFGPPKKEELSIVRAAYNIVGCKFDSYGIYWVEIEVLGSKRKNVIASTRLKVEKPKEDRLNRKPNKLQTKKN